jgi:hypothetical protein
MNILNKQFSISALIIIAIFTSAACSLDIAGGAGAKADLKPAENQSNATKTDEKSVETKAVTQQTKQENTLTVFDGREFDREPKTGTAGDKQLVNKEYQSKKDIINQKPGLECFETDAPVPDIVDAAEGSFTKPNAKQKVLLYELCRNGRAFGVGGIIVVENGQSVAHYVYGENGLFAGLLPLADANKNGLSEIVFIAQGSGQGYFNTAIDIFEFKAGDLEFIGSTETYSSNSGAVENDAKALSTAYKISIQPANNPIFYRETYQQKGSAKTWTLTKKAEKFSLNTGEPIKYYKIN